MGSVPAARESGAERIQVLKARCTVRPARGGRQWTADQASLYRRNKRASAEGETLPH